MIDNDINKLSLKYRDNILLHNKNIRLANKGLHKIYIINYINWCSYNTPMITDLDITPLYGTSFEDEYNNNYSM